MRGIDEQVEKAEGAVAGKLAVKRNRFNKLTGTKKSVNCDLETKARSLAGLKGYTTNMASPTADFVIGSYHQLWRIEKSFRMSKHDLKARPIYHHKREAIEAHLTHRVRCPGHNQIHRGPHRLVDPEVRHHRTPLPHRPNPDRQTRSHRRGSTPHRPTRRPRRSGISTIEIRSGLIRRSRGVDGSAMEAG
ncbi:hypothetical protein GCM10029976_043020 [Kribbella albertanoniae]